jgi:hypothetical protein
MFKLKLESLDERLVPDAQPTLTTPNMTNEQLVELFTAYQPQVTDPTAVAATLQLSAFTLPFLQTQDIISLGQIGQAGLLNLVAPLTELQTEFNAAVTLVSSPISGSLPVEGVDGSILVGRYQMIWNRAVHAANQLRRAQQLVQGYSEIRSLLGLAKDALVGNPEIVGFILDEMSRYDDLKIAAEAKIEALQAEIKVYLEQLDLILRELIRIQHPGLESKIPGFRISLERPQWI